MEQGGSARGNPGSWGWIPGRCIGVGGTVGLSPAHRVTGAAHLLQMASPPPTTVAVAKTRVQPHEPLDTVAQQPQPCPLFRRLQQSDHCVHGPATCGQKEATAGPEISLLVSLLLYSSLSCSGSKEEVTQPAYSQWPWLCGQCPQQRDQGLGGRHGHGRAGSGGLNEVNP